MNNALINTAQINCARINSARVSGVGTSSARSDKPVLDPALKAKLVAVWNPRYMTNDSPDRNIIKDLTGKGNDLQILNAGYKLNSGHGLYKEDFTRFYDNTGVIRTHNKVTVKEVKNITWLIYKDVKNLSVNSFSVNISGIPENGILHYAYCSSSDSTISSIIKIQSNGIYTLPKSVINTTTATFNIGFQIQNTLLDWNKITIEQIPDHQGAVVTDGVDDMIVSKKPMTEMLEGSNEFTVIGIIEHIAQKDVNQRFNVVGHSDGSVTDNRVNIQTDLSGRKCILGYTYNGTTTSVINNILGDKALYTSAKSTYSTIRPLYSVNGVYSNTAISYVDSYAYRGGMLTKVPLTTDEANQVIAYYNLDWWIEPDGWYDVAKQGITNENHATFNDKLIDYSGNGRDLQCNNFGWALNSGVGKWGIDFNNMVKPASTQLKGQKIEYIVSNDRFYPLYFRPTYNVDVSSFVVNCDFDGTLYYYYINDKGIRTQYILNKGINVLPKSMMSLNPGMYNCGFYTFDGATFGVIEQLPELEGGLWHEGIDDNCISINKFPAYKDFTAILDRQIIKVDPGCTVSKNGTSGAFLIDYSNGDYSFGGKSTAVGTSERKVRYVTKYTNSEGTIVPGTNIDQEYNISTGVIRRSDTRFAEFGLYGLLVYPYSMNDFLIERQLKKRKFGTLYPKT